MNRRQAILVVATLALLVMPIQGMVSGATASVGATRLSLTTVPPTLPADGSSYPSFVVTLLDSSAKPTVALTNVTVYLAVSQSNVGSLPPSVVIPVGQSFVIANFTTTTIPGQTTVTASSPGLDSATGRVTTQTPSGFPTQILVFTSPSVFLARPSNEPADHGTITLELTDNLGLPAQAPKSFSVSLSTSETSVASLDQGTIVFSANQTLATGSFETSFTAGSSTITAYASGYHSGSTTVTVIGPQPLQLVLSAQPSSVALNSHGLLKVSLTDQSGNPASAPSPVHVTLTSSNTSFATVPLSAVIQPGSFYTWVTFNSTSLEGSVTLTATSPGLITASSVISSSPASNPVSLRVITTPNPVLSDNSSYPNVVLVQLIGADSRPALAQINYNVSLTSSSSAIGSVPSHIIIPIGASFGLAPFSSTFRSGTTQITAQAENLLPSTAGMTTFGPVPAGISLSIYGSGSKSGAGTMLPANGGSYPALIVGLTDASGNPAVAPTPTVIQLSSANTAILSLNSTITIPEGSIAVTVPLTTTLSPGSADITAATAANLTTSALTVNTEIPAPAKLAIYVAPLSFLKPQTGNYPYLYVQLQDAQGNPATARYGTHVIVTSSNGALFNTSMSITVLTGHDYVRVPLSPLTTGSTTLTASSSGLGSSSATLNVASFPFAATVSLSRPGYIFNNETDVATLHMTLLGQPLKGVNVTWTANGVGISPKNGTTNAAGQASTTIFPGKLGSANVTVTATGPSFGTLKLAAYVTVVAVPPPPKPTLVQILLSYIYFIIAAVVAVVVASAYLLRRRRAKARAELEAGFEAVS